MTLVQGVIARAVKEFEFMPFKRKSELVRKLVDVPLDESTASSAKKAIFLRNFIEHHNFKFTTADAEGELGRKTVVLLDHNGVEDSLTQDYRLYVSLWELASEIQAFRSACLAWCPEALPHIERYAPFFKDLLINELE